MQMRRRVVNIKQVLLPFSLIIACSILILILWQVIDPLTWEVTVISEEPRETYGECRSQHILFYLVALFTLFAAIMLMTAVVSWKMKDVQSDLSESRWIFFGIFLHIQIWAIGLPVIYIVDEVSKDAEYLMYAALTFVFSTSLVVLVVWPKIYVWVRDTYFGGPGRTTRVNVADPRSTRVSGLTTPSTRERLASSTNSNVGSQRQVNRIEQLEREVDSLKRKLREHSYSGPPEQSLPASPEKAEPPAVDQNASDTNVKQQTSASLDSSSPVSLEIGERTEL